MSEDNRRAWQNAMEFVDLVQDLTASPSDGIALGNCTSTMRFVRCWGAWTQHQDVAFIAEGQLDALRRAARAKRTAEAADAERDQERLPGI
ncbi:hypothetical protein KKH23_05790 [Patescibacteria group bacterium]|nr:hypothetical protein [Patescibacteria group bacterium]